MKIEQMRDASDMALKNYEADIQAYIKKNYLQRKVKITDTEYLKLERVLDVIANIMSEREALNEN